MKEQKVEIGIDSENNNKRNHSNTPLWKQSWSEENLNSNRENDSQGKCCSSRKKKTFTCDFAYKGIRYRGFS